MGCDEHFYLEVRERGRWRIYGEKTKGKYDEEPVFQQFDLTGGRNYSAYAVLADVRNGTRLSFGEGGETGSRFTPIVQPRGMPKDVSEDVQALSDRWGADGHSHTYLTLQDFLDYPWWLEAEQSGIVNLATYFQWTLWKREQHQPPEEYSGGISGQGITFISMKEADALYAAMLKAGGYPAIHNHIKENKGFFPGERRHVNTTWQEPVTEAVGRLYTRGIPTMQRVARELSLAPKEIRTVGWFDN